MFVEQLLNGLELLNPEQEARNMFPGLILIFSRDGDFDFLYVWDFLQIVILSNLSFSF